MLVSLPRDDTTKTIDRRLARKVAKVIGGVVEESCFDFPLVLENECHANCIKYMKKHPGKYSVASGWLVFHEPNRLALIFHSMLWDKAKKKLICVTKYVQNGAVPSSFINMSSEKFDNMNYIFKEDIEQGDIDAIVRCFDGKVKVEKKKGYLSYIRT